MYIYIITILCEILPTITCLKYINKRERKREREYINNYVKYLYIWYLYVYDIFMTDIHLHI